MRWSRAFSPSRRSLTQEGTVPGIGNSYLQDILFCARVHPRRPIASLSELEVGELYRSMQTVLRAAIAQGGRNDELDLHGRAGGYEWVMHSGMTGRLCRECGRAITKIQYLGGACYFCPSCQDLARG